MTTEITKSENPPPPSSRSSLETIATFEARLAPCGERTGTAELTACLTLVAPSGMNAADRRAWLAVARETLTGIPEDLLRRGCAHARRVCKLPAEIVPAILLEIGATWDHRKRCLANAKAAEANRNAPRLEPRRHNFIPREETQAIIAAAFAGKLVGDRPDGGAAA